jgi:hypothetical protein
MTAASAAYLNKGLELTAYSLRSSLAAASGSSSGLALGSYPRASSRDHIEPCMHTPFAYGGIYLRPLAQQVVPLLKLFSMSIQRRSAP